MPYWVALSTTTVKKAIEYNTDAVMVKKYKKRKWYSKYIFRNHILMKNLFYEFEHSIQETT